MSYVVDSPLRPHVASTRGDGADVHAAPATRQADAFSSPPPVPITPIALSTLPIGQFATIHAVLSTDNEADGDLVMRLIEIGFVPGERVRVIAVGRPGGQPIAVRLAAADSGRRAINGATFALRRHEAEFIRVVPDAAPNAANGGRVR